MPGFVNDKEQHYTKLLTLEPLTVRSWRKHQYKKHPYFYLIRYQNFKKIDYIEEKILKFAKEYENFYIVLNNVFEGYAYQSFWYIQEFVKTNNLENKVIYLCGHLDSEKEYTSWCAHRSLIEEFKVMSFNVFFGSAQCEYSEYASKFTQNKNKWFCCLNHRQHPHRIATVTYLDYLNMLDEGIVTSHDKSYEDGTQFSNYEESILHSSKFWQLSYSKILKKQYLITAEKLPLIYDNVYLTDGGHSNTFNAEIYNQCLINLITETYYLNIWNFHSEMFLTEKTLRSILSKQIFIIIGPKGMLQRLKSFGFITFSDFFDESYDDCPDSTRVFTVVDTLRNIMENYDIDELNEKTLHIREHNLKILLKGNFNINLKDALGL